MAGYVIGSDEGKRIAEQMKVGEPYKASDGSTWTKKADGSVSVTTKSGNVYNNAYTSPTTTSNQATTSKVNTPSNSSSSPHWENYKNPDNKNIDDFYEKYKDNIIGISNANNVDLSVAKDMFATNVQGKSNYAGGGVLNMGIAGQDYNNALKADQTANAGKMYATHLGGGVNGDGSTGVAYTEQLYRDMAENQINNQQMQNNVAGVNALQYPNAQTNNNIQSIQSILNDNAKKYEEQIALMKAQEEEAARLQAEAERKAIENAKQNIINTYNNAAREAYIQSMQQQRWLPLWLATQGQSGGASEGAMLAINTNYQNNLAELQNARMNALAEADLGLADIESNIADRFANINSLYGQKLLEQYRENDNNMQKLIMNQMAQERDDFLQTMGQYQDDYQAQINSLLASGVPESDYRIQYLRAARAQKIIDNNLNPDGTPKVVPITTSGNKGGTTGSSKDNDNSTENPTNTARENFISYLFASGAQNGLIPRSQANELISRLEEAERAGIISQIEAGVILSKNGLI